MEHSEVFYSVDDLRFAIRDIKAGRTADAIFHLQRAFAHDSEIIEIIESEWRKSYD